MKIQIIMDGDILSIDLLLCLLGFKDKLELWQMGVGDGTSHKCDEMDKVVAMEIALRVPLSVQDG